MLIKILEGVIWVPEQQQQQQQQQQHKLFSIFVFANWLLLVFYLLKHFKLIKRNHIQIIIIIVV